MPPLPHAEALVRRLGPAREIPPDRGQPPTEKIGLCLSGGGFRAMVFHLGALLRLNDAKLLPQLDRISSVSGGSITAATLGLCWDRLDWRDGVATKLEELVVDPVCDLARHTIDISSVIEGLAPFTSIGERVAHAYREHLFGDATLQALPDSDGSAPRFVICATNLESGVLFRFSRPYMADWRVGMIRRPEVKLADAVAASSAFPPVLSPFEIDLRDARWETVKGNELTEAGYRGKIALSDGGVYDNLGLETVWKRCHTVLVSDAGGQMPDDADPPHNWPLQTLRVLRVIDNQVRDLRKRQTIGGYETKIRDGCYWGIRSDVPDYGLDDPLEFSPGEARELAGISTRLAELEPREQEGLINWGYVICDTALRRWYDPELPRPERLPRPKPAGS